MHTRLRVQRAPGIPHALYWAKDKCNDSGAARRGVADSYLKLARRHCERSEAIHSFFARRDRLLRCARNDGSTTRGLLKMESRTCTGGGALPLPLWERVGVRG